jgi:carboxymethylenebutenolidase
MTAARRLPLTLLPLVLACQSAGAPDAGSGAPAPTPASGPAAASPAVPSPADTGPLDEASFRALHQHKDGAAPAPRGETIALASGSAYLSLPAGPGPHPGVIVIHEWWGLNDHIRHWADRLAADGYAAVAVDLYGGGVATTPEAAMALMKAVDESKARAIVTAAHTFLVEDARVKAPKTGSIGWCFGGGWSLQTALAVPELDAAVVYYGRPITDPAALAPLGARVLGVFGSKDASIPASVVDGFESALRTAGKDARVLRYDAEHAFANPSSARYDAPAATAAWGEVRGFLASTLRGGD